MHIVWIGVKVQRSYMRSVFKRGKTLYKFETEIYRKY